MAEARSRDEAFGLLAQFSAPQQLLEACRRVRDAGYRRWDAHCPFPVRGLERAMGLGRSPVGWPVLALGLSGAAAGMGLQWWVSTQAYPLVIGGKPLFSWPAFVPIMFECGVLGGALGALIGFLLLARLPRPHHPLFDSARFDRATDDGWFISIEAHDPRFAREETERLLRDAGAVHVELIGA
ncbi:MAG: DUF3341 domain-containing protein [Acidobacteriota bacterium]